MDQDSSRPQTLRERTREAVRDQVRTAALELFVERGFDATTTEDIAGAVGISPRSFFRYFVTKEDVLIGGSIAFGDHVCDALAARPPAEPIWVSLRRSLDPVAAATVEDDERNLQIMRIVMSAASLRAHNYEKHLAWEQMMVPIITARIDGTEEAALQRAETLAHVTMACLDVALSQWVRHDGSRQLSKLLDGSFAQLGTGSPTSSTRGLSG
jgi:AcrR family transcriptional regulator